MRDRWVKHFANNGYPATLKLAVGMEGAVYSLVPGKFIAKVWHRQDRDLKALQAFYRKLASYAGPVATPEILDIKIIDGNLVSIEKSLPGSPLEHRISSDAGQADPLVIESLIEILSFLRSVPESAEFSSLPVLNESESPWIFGDTWSAAIGGLIEHRLERFGRQLEIAIADLRIVVAAVHDFLRSRDGQAMALMHGDLCTQNIMVDAGGRPLAVLDFGFLSSMGDPAFDASICSAIFNMYGLHAHEIDAQVTAAISAALGWDRDVLLGYRAVYALATSNVYALNGSDDHYKWCVAMLRRADVRVALGL